LATPSPTGNKAIVIF